MCVILISNPGTARLTETTITNAALCNGDGIGVAWLDGPKVQWAKGLALLQAIELAQMLPQPYMFHFRLATIGKAIPQLTHPFPMCGEIAEDLEGRTTHGVLMHNGHWGTWEKEFKLHATPRWVHQFLSDKDRWSDSRGMAYLASRMGYQILPKIAATGQKISVLTRRGIRTYGLGWTTLTDGTIASNTYFNWGSDFRHNLWDDNDWPGSYAGYAGYLYRTRRHNARGHGSVQAGSHDPQIGRIPLIQVDPEARYFSGDTECPKKGEVAEGFVYPSEIPRTKRLADLTEDEWMMREAALNDEDCDWELARRVREALEE